jgi:hypothetical protein
MMYLAHHKRKFCSFPRGRIKRQFACPNLAARFEGENVDAGKQDRRDDVRCCVEEEGVGVLEEEKRRLGADGHHPQKDIATRADITGKSRREREMPLPIFSPQSP